MGGVGGGGVPDIGGEGKEAAVGGYVPLLDPSVVTKFAGSEFSVYLGRRGEGNGET